MADHVEGKVPVYNLNTGECVEYWPIDAGEVVGGEDSEWSMTPRLNTAPALGPPKAAKKVDRKASAKKAPKRAPKKRSK